MAEAGVHGLRDLRNDLRRVSAQLPRELRGELKAGAELTAAAVRLAVPTLSGRAEGSVRAGATQISAYVKGGTQKRAPHFGWLDFGGTIAHHDHAGRPTGGKISRPRIPGGRYLYPAVSATAGLLADRVVAGVDRLLARAGFR